MICNYVVHNAIGSIDSAYYPFPNDFKKPYVSCVVSVVIVVVMFAMALTEVCVIVVVCTMSCSKCRNRYPSSMALSGCCYLWFGVVV